MKIKILLCFFILITLHSYSQRIELLSNKINTSYPELAPCISPDDNTLFFSRTHHPDNIATGETDMDIWFSTKNAQGSWTKAQHAAAPLNDEWANSVQAVFPQSQQILIRGAYQNGKYIGVGWSVAKRTPNGWAAPEMLQIPDYSSLQRGQHSSASLSADGTILIMGFSEKAGDTDADLYVTFKDTAGHWIKPISLGEDINTPDFVEDTPFLAADGQTLYFASNRPDGFGQLDIYMSQRQDKTWQRWSKPQNLGKRINSAASELFFSMPNTTTDYAYMSVYRPDEGHTSDIVQVWLPDWAKPTAVLTVSGKVFNSQSKEPVAAQIFYQILPDGSHLQVPAAADGSYNIALAYGYEYAIWAQKPNYWASSAHLDLTKVEMRSNSFIEKNLELTPLQKGSDLTIDNLFFEVNKSEILPSSLPALERLATLFRTNPAIHIEIIGHTDSTGNVSDNLILADKRAKAVSDFLIQQKQIPAEKVAARGAGSSQPIAPNSTEEGRAKNRRVNFVIRKL